MVDRANGKPSGGQEKGCSPGGCAGTTQVFGRPAQENGGCPRGGSRKGFQTASIAVPEKSEPVFDCGAAGCVVHAHPASPPGGARSRQGNLPLLTIRSQRSGFTATRQAMPIAHPGGLLIYCRRGSEVRFGHKIGLAFLALTILTVATGSIGLLFVYRVLSVLGSVSGEEEPLVRNLEDLNRYVRKAVALSRDVSGDLDPADLVQLRREFDRVAHEFDRAFQEIRRDVEDELSLGRIEEMGEEQRALKEQTRSLINAIVEELVVRRRLNDGLSVAHSAWRSLVQALGMESLEPPVSGQDFGAWAWPGEDRALAPADSQTAALRRMQVLPQVQHLLMLLRLELNEYFALEDAKQLEQADLRVRALFARATAAVGTLYAFSLEPGANQRTEHIEAAFLSWRDALTRPEGALELSLIHI